MSQGKSTVEWSVLKEGIHKGKSLPELFFNETEWFMESCNRGHFDGTIHQWDKRLMFLDLVNVRIPLEGNQKVHYLLDWRDLTLSGFELANPPIITSDAKAMQQSLISSLVENGPMWQLDVERLKRHLWSDTLNFNFPYWWNFRDGAYENIMRSYKKLYLGDQDIILDRKWCEEFFMNKDNFNPIFTVY